MTVPVLSVREIQPTDIQLITDYWLNADSTFLAGMGVEVSKLPTREQFTQNLLEQIQLALEQKNSYCIIWEVDGVAAGHCNTNPTVFGEEAFMHLHLWNGGVRKKGMGVLFVKLALPYFFEKLKLKTLYSEPYALNEAPNKTLPKAGFELVREYVTIPGSFSFEQPVRRWKLTDEQFRQLQKIK